MTTLITGAAGSIGSALVPKFLERGDVRAFDNNETGLFDLGERHPGARLLVGDVRDRERLALAMRGRDLDTVIHCAALKHVPLCEYNPFEAAAVNITGTQHVIECAIRERVGWVLVVSTDKAVNPVSVMGATKMVAERIAIGAAEWSGHTRIAVARLGNVIGSRGSLLPIAVRRILAGEPVPITVPDMTRFWMAADHATDFLATASDKAVSGETWIPPLRSASVEEFIAAAYRHCGVEPKPPLIVGRRPGEKRHEELWSAAEYGRITTLSSPYIVAAPWMCQTHPSPPTPEHGSSDTAPRVAVEELAEWMRR